MTKQVVLAATIILLLSIFPARSQVENWPKREKPVKVLTFPRGAPPPSELILSSECDRHKFTTPAFSTDTKLAVVMSKHEEYNKRSINHNIGGLQPNAGKTGYFEIGIDKAEDNWLKVVISFPGHSLGGITPPKENGKVLKYKSYKEVKEEKPDTKIPILFFYADDEQGTIEKKLKKFEKLSPDLNDPREKHIYNEIESFHLIYYIYSPR